MKTKVIILTMIFAIGYLFAQSPRLYIHFVSHNEPTDNLDAPPGINYNKAKTNVLQMAAIIDARNVKWNLQTSDGFVIGALQYDSAGTSPNDVFERLANPPYNDNIEIDPRSKNKNGRNIADQWYLLDSIGANPSKTVGGFLWYICQPSTMQPDWWQYQDTLMGAVYGNKVKFGLLSGAGSAGASLHCNDLNDFGIFKPDTITNFYQHNPNRNLWCVGTGCAPVLDSLSDEQSIIDLIQGQVDSIQSGLWPANKFYVTRIMTNQREYGPLFFQKLSKVIDSLSIIPSTQLQWATISETFAEFLNWQNSTTLDFSQWQCGQTSIGTSDLLQASNHRVFPNPFNTHLSIEFSDEILHQVEIMDIWGRTCLYRDVTENASIDLSALSNGVYLIRIDNQVERIIKYE